MARGALNAVVMNDTAGDAAGASRGRLAAELGYGLGGPNALGVVTSYAEIAFRDDRTWRFEGGTGRRRPRPRGCTKLSLGAAAAVEAGRAAGVGLRPGATGPQSHKFGAGAESAGPVRERYCAQSSMTLRRRWKRSDRA